MTTSDTARAVRNNNPGNIERGAPWQGLQKPEDMTPDQALERRFAVFKAPKWGFRAMAVTLITYQDKRQAKDGSSIDTIAKVIERWAPPTENSTSAYVQAVDRIHPKGPRDHLDLHTFVDLAPLVKGMATVESGGWFWNDKDLEAGLTLAGVPKPAEKLAKSRTMVTATAGVAATGIGMISENIDQITPAVGIIRDIADYAPLVAGILVLCLFGGVVWFKYDDWRRAKA